MALSDFLAALLCFAFLNAIPYNNQCITNKKGGCKTAPLLLKSKVKDALF